MPYATTLLFIQRFALEAETCTMSIGRLHLLMLESN